MQIAIGSKDHTTLVAMVQAANLENVLVNAGPLTVFTDQCSIRRPASRHSGRLVETRKQIETGDHHQVPCFLAITRATY
ncbi:MAG: hypothetical protein R2788_09015 [Saprospiraceae bacterium]